ncbi:hypothetical protein ACFW9D_07965 [Streptomyces sp. NPDC059524]|uniref:hypothetical protein n=1 Tax=Streptomyces sp. NPDC059524 TaxID=3346856 RepID=UPI0036C8FD00
MAWDEWEQLKQQASERSSTQMQLNQLAESGGGGRNLMVYDDDLGEVGHEAHGLHGDLRKQADVDGMGADKQGNGPSGQAAAELKGQNFTMGGALAETVRTWSSQVDSLLQACAHISNHLNYSKKAHAQDDATIAASVRNSDGSTMSVSELNKYFK